MTNAHAPEPFVLTFDDIEPQDADAVLDMAAASRADVATFEVTGQGAVQCIQGITTNDIVLPGDNSVIYGAFLTPKGMIISDAWFSRMGETVSIVVPSSGKEEVLDTLNRSVPPRLARIFDVSADTAVFRIVGPLAFEVAARAGFKVPEPGRCTTCKVGASEYLVSRPEDPSPFALQISGMRVDIHDVNLSLSEAGAQVAGAAALELARVIAGWPAVGAEIGSKTLPQEVRYDEINGVSYTKGCYTGQETVARLHFRGHANRELMGLAWEEDPDLDKSSVLRDEKEVGHVTSVVWLDPIDQYIGLGVISAKVDNSESVVACGVEATLVELPFRFDS